MAIKEAKIITVTSVKGGTGKTTTTLNLAGEFSKKNLKTVIIDLDLHSGNVAAALNVETEGDIYTLVDDLGGNRFKQIEDYLKKYNQNIDILPAPKDPRNVGKIHPSYIEIILNRLRYKYDVILIDTSHVTHQINLITFDASDFIIYVMSNDLMDIKNMKTMISIYEDMNVQNYTILLNNALGAAPYSVYEIESLLDINLKYILPKTFNIKNIQKYVENGKIITLEKPYLKHKGTLVLEKLASVSLK